MSTRWLVTGSDGFIGGAFSRNAIENADVSLSFLKESDLGAGPNLERELVAFLNKSDPVCVFHFGACSNTLENRIQYIMEKNFEVTRIISDWCKLKNRTLVYSSSAAVYGSTGALPSNLYGWSKYAAEKIVLANGGVALRYFNVYGPGEDNKGDMASIFLQSYIKTLNNIEVELFPGRPKRDFVYIEDVVTANLNAWQNFQSAMGMCFEVGSGEARAFEEGLDIMGIEYSYSDASKIPDGYQFSTKSASEKWLPSWQPRFSLNLGLRDYVTYLEKKYGRLND